MFGSTRALVRVLYDRMGRPVLGAAIKPVTSRWAPYSRLMLISDSPLWSVSWDMRELAIISRRLGIRVASGRWRRITKNQAVFYGSRLGLQQGLRRNRPHRLALAYLHGRPGSGVLEFDESYEKLCQFHPQVRRIQVTHSEMRDLVLSSGIAAEKVFLIPIGINLPYFPFQSAESRRRARERLGIPESAIVVGSFQKDGVGWGEGLEPKLVKGPDVFLDTIELLKPRISELFVLLSGPARGYVKAGLERIRVPYLHHYVKHYPDLGQFYQALDMYIVASRQEGGPKAVLESMAAGVPLVTTRVGQAMDLVQHGKNGWMVDVEDVEALAHWAEYGIMHRNELDGMLEMGRQLADANSYELQLPLWHQFMDGFVQMKTADSLHIAKPNDLETSA